jgi:hypothetical protein
MNRLKQVLLTALGIMVLSLALSIAWAGRAVADAISLVKVANSRNQPALVRNVDDPANRTPVNAKLDFSTTSPMGCVSYSVPSGKRLVIETVSVRVSASAPAAQVWLQSVHSVWFYMPLVKAVSDFVGTQAMRVYVDGGQSYAFAACAEPPANGSMSVSGYLVDIPPPSP